MSRLILVPSFLLVLALPASGEPPAEVARLIKQLGSDSFAGREEATKTLGRGSGMAGRNWGTPPCACRRGV